MNHENYQSTQREFDEWLDLVVNLWSDASADDMMSILNSPREEGVLVI